MKLFYPTLAEAKDHRYACIPDYLRDPLLMELEGIAQAEWNAATTLLINEKRDALDKLAEIYKYNVPRENWSVVGVNIP